MVAAVLNFAIFSLAEEGATPMKTEKAILAGGCFWCTESVFKKIHGVIDVLAGYTGGEEKDPNYEERPGSGGGYDRGIQEGTPAGNGILP